jgi:hypothetical protein
VPVIAGCAATASSTAPKPTPAPVSLGCAWYSPVGASMAVSVTATGPACSTLSAQLVTLTGRTWTSESVIPGSYGTLLAQLGHAGSVVRVWFTGTPEQAAGPVAGMVADDFQHAGWSPQ